MYTHNMRIVSWLLPIKNKYKNVIFVHIYVEILYLMFILFYTKFIMI